MANRKVILIAMGVSIVDIRAAWAMQKLNPNEYTVINDEKSACENMPSSKAKTIPLGQTWPKPRA